MFINKAKEHITIAIKFPILENIFAVGVKLGNINDKIKHRKEDNKKAITKPINLCIFINIFSVKITQP